MSKLRILAVIALLAFVAVGVSSCAAKKGDPCPCLSSNCDNDNSRV